MATFTSICMLLFSFFAAINALAAAPKPVNLVKNGDFETGQLRPWKFEHYYKPNKSGYTINKGCLRTGEYCFQYSAATVYDPGLEGPDAGFTISQNITTEIGATYHLSLDYFSRPRGAERGDSYVIEAGDTGWVSNNIRSGKLAHFDGTFQAKKTVTEISLTFDSDPYYSYDTHQFTQLDNIKVMRIKI